MNENTAARDRSEVVLRNMDDQTADEITDVLADYGVRPEAEVAKDDSF